MGNKIQHLAQKSFEEEAALPRAVTVRGDDYIHNLVGLPKDRGSDSGETYQYKDLSVEGGPVVFASPFLLRVDGSQSFFRSGYKDMCLVGTTLDTTSLMTFHGPKGEQKNKRGQKTLLSVKENEVVTLYANITGGGKYLSAQGISSRRNPALAWSGSMSEVRRDSEPYEFYVRVAKAASANRKSERAKRVPSGTGHPSRTTLVENRDKTRRVKSFSLSHLRKSLEVRASSMYNSRETKAKREATFDDIRTVSDEYNSDSEQEVIEEESAPRAREVGTIEEVNINQATAQDAEVIDLKIGDVISLESKSRPGYFVRVMSGSNMVHLSRTHHGKFEITAPELRHLITLNKNRFSRMINPREVQEEVVVLRESDKQWLRLLKQLPLDIVYRVLQYKGNWVRSARLVCKQWCRAAELNVRSIRVAGDYEYTEAQKDRIKLFAFARRCKFLTAMTLRSTEGLYDEHLENLCEIKTLRNFSLGGCKDITDVAVSHIVKCKQLEHLNLAVTQITDAGLEAISKSLNNLNNLNVYSCDNLTLDGILDLIRNLASLTEINIRGCNVEYLHENSVREGCQVLTGPKQLDDIYS